MRDCLGDERCGAAACQRCGYEPAECSCVGGYVHPVLARPTPPLSPEQRARMERIIRERRLRTE
jgi:hypothetical protein